MIPRKFQFALLAAVVALPAYLVCSVPLEAGRTIMPNDSVPSPGQIRLDGILADPIDSTSTQFHANVFWVTMPGERRSVLPDVRSKLITISPATVFTVLHRPSLAPTLFDIASRPFRVTAIGPISKTGAPLAATAVDIEIADPAELALCDAIRAHDPPSRASAGPPPSIALKQAVVNAGDAPHAVQYVTVAPGTFRIAVGLAHDTVGATEPLASIATRNGAVAAINGSFFDCYDPGPTKMPDNPLISGGRIVSRGNDIGTVLGQTPDGELRMDRAFDVVRWHDFDPEWSRPSGARESPDDMLFWERAVEAVGCGPRLVDNGAISFDPGAEGYSDPDMLSGVSVRSAIGITAAGGIVLIVTHASLPELAKIMLQLGCKDAMNLDGGSSSGLWLRGNSIRSPGRDLSNAVMIMPR
jgi:exopolysaccharide biosynthesis protein